MFNKGIENEIKK